MRRRYLIEIRVEEDTEEQCRQVAHQVVSMINERSYTDCARVVLDCEDIEIEEVSELDLVEEVAF